MDWKSKRVGAILEAALAEDKAANDITTALTIPPNLKASGTIIAKQACVVSGLGCIPVFLDIFAKISSTPVGRFEVPACQAFLRLLQVVQQRVIQEENQFGWRRRLGLNSPIRLVARCLQLVLLVAGRSSPTVAPVARSVSC